MMRLTLRTLLAYLDDTLEPGESREIGRKVQESPVAASLVSRLKEVVRRRRLQAPDLSGPGMGLDPAVVAQYLDNTLSDNDVADVERVCLESDAQLAEVAAVHQILTLALGEPAELSSNTRERLYALGPVAEGDRLVMPALASAQKATAPVAGFSQSPTDWESSFSSRLPDELRPNPWMARFWPLVAIVLLAGVWIGLIVSDNDFMDSFKRNPAAVASKSDQANDKMAAEEGKPVVTPEPVAAANVPPVAPVEPAKPAEPLRNPVPAEVAAKSEAMNGVIPPGLDPVPPPDAPETTTPPARPAGEAVAAIPSVTPPKSPSVTTTTPAVSQPAPTQPTEPGAPAPDAVMPEKAVTPPAETPQNPDNGQPLPVRIAKESGPALRDRPRDRDWFSVEPNETLSSGDRVASPAPFETVLTFHNGAFQVELLSGSSVELLGKSPAGDVGLAPRRGRVILSVLDETKLPQVLALKLGEQFVRVEMLTKDTRFAVDVAYRTPAGLDTIPIPAETVSIYVASGALRWASADGKSAQADAPSHFRWEPKPSADAALAGTTSEVMPLLVVPEWLNPEARRLSSVLQPFANQFQALFEPEVPIEQSIAPLMKERRPMIAQLAVQCLATTQNLPGLVQALAQSPHEEARAAARDGLREWLVRHPTQGRDLRDELSRRYPAAEVETLYRLIWGYSPADGRDPNLSRQLVDWLRSGLTEVRELAIFQLEQVTGKRYDYRPLATASQREAGVQRWETHLNREGGTLLPAME